MTDPSDAPETLPPPEEAWRPSPLLRTRLGYGALAALAAGALSAGSTIAELSGGGQQGYTLATALWHASVLPEVWVLLALVGLARETGSDGLKRSAVGLIVAGWLFALLGFAEEGLLPEPWPMVVLAAAALGMAGLIGYVLYPLLKGGGCLVVFGIFLVLRLLRRLLRGNAGIQQLGGPVVLLVGLGAAVGLFLVAVDVWFAVSLLRLRRKLGPAAAVNGIAHLAGLLVILGLVAWLVAGLIPVFNQPGADDEDFERAFTPRMEVLLTVALLGEVVGCLLTVWLFLSARSRGALEASLYDLDSPGTANL